jgi:cytochrome c2
LSKLITHNSHGDGIDRRADMLDRWLAGAGDLVPRNDMAFQVQKAEERRAIIAYLKQTSAK